MSATNAHPGLSFGSMNGAIRRGGQGFPPPPTTTTNNNGSSKQQGLPQQHAASPYHQQQHYSPQQPQQTTYPHLFPTPNPSSAHNAVQNGARPQHSQAQLPVPSSRQPRTTTHRQMPAQSNNSPISYLPTAMGSQSMPQQSMSTQPMGQQSMGPQPMGPQSMGQQSMGQQSMGQQPLSQQTLSQQAISQQAINHQQSMSQDNAMMSQGPPQHPHPVLTPQPPPQPQIQPPPQPQQPQQIQNDGAVQNQDAQNDDTMDVDSQGESAEGDESALDAKSADNTPFVPRTPMGPMMSAPPEGGSYPTLDAVHKAVLEYCTSVGYAIVIGRSKKTVPGLKKVLFVCDRAGKPPKRVSPEMRKRKTTSRKCDCQFGFFAIEQRTQWTVRYRPDPGHLQHNHEPSESPKDHPAARKLDSKMVAAVKSLKESGIGVSQTLEILQAENPHIPLLPRDIYNARAAINRNPQKVNAGLAEDRPAIYSKPRPSAEERIISDLRKEIAKAKEDLQKEQEESKKKIAELESKLQEKDKSIQKYEMFVDLCNERVMIQREKLKGLDDSSGAGNNS